MEILRKAENIVRDTGRWIAESRLARGTGNIDLKGNNDFVTQTDVEAEKRLVKALSLLIPDAGFVTEENTVSQSTDHKAKWIIDPIDGTTNFVFGLPCYSVSVALEVNNELEWGMVYEISRDESFVARKNHGAYLNGKPIKIRESAGLKDALIATGFPYTSFDWMPQYLHLLSDVLDSCMGVRRWGSAAVDLSYVACGRFSGYFEYNLNPWDVAAGILLVREAGGIVTAFDGQSDPVYNRSVVCGSPLLVNDLTKLIQNKFLL